MKHFKHVSRMAALALACAMVAQGAFAANGSLALDQAALATFEGGAYAALGAANLATAVDTTQQLTMTATVSGTSVKLGGTNFLGVSDGFNQLMGLAGNISYTKLSMDVSNGTLSGSLTGGGLFLSALSYTGDLLVATAVTADGANASTFSGFDYAPALRAYLADIQAPETLVPLPAMITSVSVPVKSTFVPSAQVPEPATYALTGLGLVGLSLVARKRN